MIRNVVWAGPQQRGRGYLGGATEAEQASRLGRKPVGSPRLLQFRLNGPRDTRVVRARAPHSRRLRRRHGASEVSVMRSLPFFRQGQVMHGFGRRSKQLGIPTANFPEQVVDNLPADVCTGIYYGWASVGSGDVHKMVVSIGRNPYCKNVKNTKETHVIHTFKEDFYREILNVAGHCWLPQT